MTTTVIPLMLAAALSLARNGVDLTVEVEPETVDPARSVFVTVTAAAPAEVEVTLPDFSSRVRGFSRAEVFDEGPVTDQVGRVTHVSNWQLVPEPCADVYRIAPFVVRVMKNGEDASFVAGPVYLNPPAARESVEGGLEIDPQKDRPPFSWKLLGRLACWSLAGLAVLALLGFLVRALMRRVKEHFMSPIERARVELDRLLAKDLPRKGLYKDFYVELTMVVRRYVQRQHGVRAPHLTTEEFFEATRRADSFPQSTLDLLIDFLRKADMVKFAGVEATEETSAAATDSARTYMDKDNEIVARKKGGAR